MIALLLAAALACMPSATPGKIAPDSTKWDGPPPPRFQGPASFNLTTMRAEAISGVCDAGHPPACPVHTVACTISDHVYVPDPCSSEYRNDRFAQIVCHEKGHINGWPATHGP